MSNGCEVGAEYVKPKTRTIDGTQQNKPWTGAKLIPLIISPAKDLSSIVDSGNHPTQHTRGYKQPTSNVWNQSTEMSKKENDR